MKISPLKMNLRVGGFSLVEILVVIAVIGVLTGMAMVAYGGVRENAENNVDLRNAKTVSLMAMAVIASGSDAFDSLATEEAVVERVLQGVFILGQNGTSSFASTGIDPALENPQRRISPLLDWDQTGKVLTLK